MKVYVGSFGSGLGHATRMLEVADVLRRSGVEVMFSSSGEVVAMIRGRGYRCNSIPLADVRYTENGAFSLRETMTASPVIVARTYQQTYMESRNIAGFGPDAVLSDSSLPTVLAARLSRVPVFTVLNQLSLTGSHGPSGAPARLLSVGTSAAMGKLWELSDEILLPDLPPPYTISERNLWGSDVAKTRYIGFLRMTPRGEPDPLAERFGSDTRRKVFWQVSGPPKTRGSFLAKAVEVAKALADKFVFVVSGGDPGGNPDPRQIPGGWYFDWVRSPEAYFAACDVVVSRAGHGTISQAIISSKPSLLVPIPRQPEQEGNALKAERLGVSVRIPQDRLSVPQVSEGIESLLGKGTAERTAKLGAYANGFHAAEEIASTLAEAAS